MTRDDLVAWATTNGFEADGDRLSCPWGDRTIRIDILRQGATAHVEQGGVSVRLGLARSLDDLVTDEHGVVWGIGLDTVSLSGAIHQGDFPPWFSDELVRKLSQAPIPAP